LPVIAKVIEKSIWITLKKCNLYFVIEIHFKSNWSNSVGMITTQLGDRSYTGRRDVCGYGWSETVTCRHGDCAFNQNWDMIRQNATLIKHIRIQHNMHVSFTSCLLGIIKKVNRFSPSVCRLMHLCRACSLAKLLRKSAAGLCLSKSVLKSPPMINMWSLYFWIHKDTLHIISSIMSILSAVPTHG